MIKLFIYSLLAIVVGLVLSLYSGFPGDPGYLLIDLWAKAVERAGTVEASAVTAELEKMDGEPTVFGPRSFSDQIHHQNSAEMQIVEITDGKPGVIGSFTISEPVPLDVLLK